MFTITRQQDPVAEYTRHREIITVLTRKLSPHWRTPKVLSSDVQAAAGEKDINGLTQYAIILACTMLAGAIVARQFMEIDNCFLD